MMVRCISPTCSSRRSTSILSFDHRCGARALPARVASRSTSSTGPEGGFHPAGKPGDPDRRDRMVLANLATIIFQSDYRRRRSPTAPRLVPARLLEGLARGHLPVHALDRFLYHGLLITRPLVLSDQDGHGQIHPRHGAGPDAAQLMGVNVERMRVITFGLGSSLVGAAGCLFIRSTTSIPT